MYQPEPRYEPSHRDPFESPGEYNDRLRREEREFNETHQTEQEFDRRRFNREMREAYGEEHPT